MENKNSSGTSMNPSDTPEECVTGPSQNLPGPIMEVRIKGSAEARAHNEWSTNL